MLNRIRRFKYIRALLKETNDVSFISSVNDLNDKISRVDCIDASYHSKIEKHYYKIISAFFNKNNSNLEYLEAKKIAYNYHIYMLRDYYNRVNERLFFEKLSN